MSANQNTGFAIAFSYCVYKIGIRIWLLFPDIPVCTIDPLDILCFSVYSRRPWRQMTVDEKQMCIAAVSYYVILGLVIGALGATGRVLFLTAFIY
jgi:hypothetical protein